MALIVDSSLLLRSIDRFVDWSELIAFAFRPSATDMVSNYHCDRPINRFSYIWISPLKMVDRSFIRCEDDDWDIGWLFIF